jgi:hypothetical protein
VIAHIPTFVDKNTANGVETYTYDAAKNLIDVKFTYTNLEGTKDSCVDQTATVPTRARAHAEYRLRLANAPKL